MCRKLSEPFVGAMLNEAMESCREVDVLRFVTIKVVAWFDVSMGQVFTREQRAKVARWLRGIGGRERRTETLTSATADPAGGVPGKVHAVWVFCRERQPSEVYATLKAVTLFASSETRYSTVPLLLDVAGLVTCPSAASFSTHSVAGGFQKAICLGPDPGGAT